MLQHSVLTIFKCNISTRCSCFWKMSGVPVPWSGKNWMQVASMDKIWDKKRNWYLHPGFAEEWWLKTPNISKLPVVPSSLKWKNYRQGNWYCIEPCSTFIIVGRRAVATNTKNKSIRTVHGEYKRPKWCWWLEWVCFVMINGVPQKSLSIVFENLNTWSEPLQMYGLFLGS